MAGNIGVFLDRDGTINVDVDYLRTPGALRLIEGSGAAIRKLNASGVITCVVSNQSGVARGFLTEDDLEVIHRKLRSELAAEGASLDRIYYCPHHPTEGVAPYNIACECRKPKPGMLQQASRELALDLQRSFVVGDSVADMAAGNSVGATTVLVQTGYGPATLAACAEQHINIGHVAPSIVEAVEFILQNITGEQKQND